MSRILFAVLLCLLLAAPAGAARVTCPAGTLTTTGTAQVATGASTNQVVPTNTRCLAIQYVENDDTSTVETQICCTDTCTAIGDWATVSGSSLALDAAGVATRGIGIDNPTCQYRTNVTVCGAGPCSVDTFYRCCLEAP